jgi:hypothetical protein
MIVALGFVLTFIAAYGLFYLGMWRFWKDPNGVLEGAFSLFLVLLLGCAGAWCGWAAFQGGFYLLLILQGLAIVAGIVAARNSKKGQS